MSNQNPEVWLVESLKSVKGDGPSRDHRVSKGQASPRAAVVDQGVEGLSAAVEQEGEEIKRRYSEIFRV